MREFALGFCVRGMSSHTWQDFRVLKGVGLYGACGGVMIFNTIKLGVLCAWYGLTCLAGLSGAEAGKDFRVHAGCNDS